MSTPRSIEITADNVDDAIARGLSELGVGPMEVIVEVLEEPSKGVFGIGARPARVRLQLLSAPKPPAPPPAQPEPAAETPAPTVESESRPEPRRRERPRSSERPPREERQPRREQSPATDTLDFDLPDDEDSETESLFLESHEIFEESALDEEAQVGKVVLNELLERMNIRSQIVVRRARASRDGEAAPWILDVVGTEQHRLVGRRGETLASLQYITRLITSRELQRRSNLIVDIGGYKARRARMLQGLAQRMADQAVEVGRIVPLEPMPPHERRIIHLALRGRDDVETRSIGEGSARKVTIVPKTES